MGRRRDKHGRYWGLKVRLDRNSGEVNLRIPYRDLREVFTAAALNCYDSVKKADGRRNPEEARAYHDGLLAFVRGMEVLLDDQLRPAWAKGPLSVEERRKAALESKRERQLFDDVLAAMLAERVSQG